MRQLDKPRPYNSLEYLIAVIVLTTITAIAGYLAVTFTGSPTSSVIAYGTSYVVTYVLWHMIVTLHRKLDYLIQQNSSKE
ncbi:MAG TPA: hypothetical protein PLK06_03900 [bacterium]|nr:hypothetical protein [bacterium]